MCKVIQKEQTLAEQAGEILWLNGYEEMEYLLDMYPELDKDDVDKAYNKLEESYRNYEKKEKLLTLHEQAIEEEMDDYNDLYRDL